jgi:hypothetical protein
MLMLSGTINRARCWAIIAPAVQVGFYHIVFSFSDTDASDEEGDCGLLEFTKKPIRADHVDHSLEYMARTSTAELSKMSADELDGEEPWAYNRFAYSSHQDYVDKVILGKFWRAAA